MEKESLIFMLEKLQRAHNVMVTGLILSMLQSLKTLEPVDLLSLTTMKKMKMDGLRFLNATRLLSSSTTPQVSL